MVESHIMGGTSPSAGILSQSEPKGGTPDWNSKTVSAKESFAGEDGLQNLVNNQKLGPSIFNAPGQKITRDTGVNYKPAINAGNRLTEDPFQLADGFPGN